MLPLLMNIDHQDEPLKGSTQTIPNIKYMIIVRGDSKIKAPLNQVLSD